MEKGVSSSSSSLVAELRGVVRGRLGRGSVIVSEYLCVLVLQEVWPSGGIPSYRYHCC